MGSVCSRNVSTDFTNRKTAQYHPLDPLEQALRLRQEQQQGLFQRTLAETFRSSTRNLWLAGLVRWIAVVINLVVGISFSRVCGDGTHWQSLQPVIMVSCLAAALAMALERCASNTLISFPQRVATAMDAADNAVPDEDLKIHLQAYIKATSAFNTNCASISSLVYHWIFLQVGSGLVLLELFLNSALPGSVQDCEENHPDVHSIHLREWIPLSSVDSSVKFQLSRAYFAVVIIAILFRGGLGLYEATIARHLAKTFVNDGSDDNNGHSLQTCSWLHFESKVAAFSYKGMATGDWAGSVCAKSIFAELASEFTKRELLDQGRTEGDLERSLDTFRLHVQAVFAVRVLLLQQLPCLWLSQAFVGRYYSFFSRGGVAFVLLSFGITARNVFAEVISMCFRCRCSSPYLTLVPLLIGVSAMVVTIVAAAQFIGVYSCDEHTFSLRTWSCAS